jgi:hypothetical protein
MTTTEPLLVWNLRMLCSVSHGSRSKRLQFICGFVDVLILTIGLVVILAIVFFVRIPFVDHIPDHHFLVGNFADYDFIAVKILHDDNWFDRVYAWKLLWFQ